MKYGMGFGREVIAVQLAALTNNKIDTRTDS
jgi:hypothetical protein